MAELVLKKWEGRIYNELVRDSLASGEEMVLNISPTWAEAHYIVVWAYTEEHAREQLEHQYHKNNGFVVTDIIEII